MSERYEGQTYYELLEISPKAGTSDIYTAYQRAKATYSPSSPALYSMFTPQEAQELMALIEEAYQTLSHQARRREYDVTLGLAKPEKPSATPTKRVDDPWISPVKVAPRNRDEIPKGFARTKFSVYEVKPEMESQLGSLQECDGQWIQKARLYKGVTLDQLSEEIRVMKSTLIALEANDLEALPVAVFVRGFVVQIARVLGLDEKAVPAAYMQFFKAKKGAK